MVSLHPNPPPGQGFAHFYSYHFGGDPISSPGMKITGKSDGASVESPSKKTRKPYTITKARENWSEQEHDKFLEAVHLFDRDWKKIEAFVASKTVIQIVHAATYSSIASMCGHHNNAIRSHAQKYFMKAQKNGTSEHIPPPRPKRKAAHPYPHKAPKRVSSQPTELLSSSAVPNSRYALGPQSMPLPGNIVANAPSYTWTPSGMLPDCVSPLSKDDFASSGSTMTRNWSSNCNEIAPHVWTSNEANHLVNENLDKKRAIPDFHQVYSFIGNMFDTSASPSEHLKTLKKMDRITVKTVLMLMKNLSVNLVSPEFENHWQRMLLSSYENAGTENESVRSETPAAA